MIYADWLEEQDRHEEATFIQTQLATPGADPYGHDFAMQAQYLMEAAKRLPLSWRRIVARAPIENCDVKFELECPKTWESLAPTADAEKRFCNACAKPVHYAPSVQKARQLAVLGHCVAVDVGEKRNKGDLAKHYGQNMRMGMVVRLR